MSSTIITDNGGRRSGIDRRQFSYYEHIPERRSGKDRRNGNDRRSSEYKHMGIIERRDTFLKAGVDDLAKSLY